MSGIRNYKSNYFVNYNTIGSLPTLPTASIKPDTIETISVSTTNTTLAPGTIVIPEETSAASASATGTETIPVLPHAIANAPLPESSSNTGNSGSSTGDSEDSSGTTGTTGTTGGSYGSVPPVPTSVDEIMSIIASGTFGSFSIPSSYTDAINSMTPDTFSSILTSNTSGKDPFGGIIDTITKITNFTVGTVGTFSWWPDFSFSKEWRVGITGSIRF